jgi:hypothetical protein
MPEKEKNIRISGIINPKKEPDLAKATASLLKSYSMSDLSKEAFRCIARREGLLPAGVGIA